MYNSNEFIKSKLAVSQDGLTAYIHSYDVCNHINDLSDRDEAFNEAIDVITSAGWIPTESELETIEGGCTQYFKINY